MKNTDQRTILHVDADCFYASCMMNEYPSLRGKCVAVAGDPANRHGIILAKSYEAKKYGIQTAEAIWQAKQKCPHLIVIGADYHIFKYYATLLRNIYFKYTDHVEAFGLDENWLDVTSSLALFGSGRQIAQAIQEDVTKQIGISVSIGIGWNKVVAKFGSDCHKPNGITEINEHNFKELFWRAPIEKLLYVGNKTTQKYHRWGIMSIGDLANDTHFITQFGNKVDHIIQYWAQGYDSASVHNIVDAPDPVKSVGNSITTPRDIHTLAECKLVYIVLCESVATRLKRINQQGCVISITLRRNDLTRFSKQKKIAQHTNIAEEILQVVMSLVEESYDFTIPLRSIGVALSSLKDDSSILQPDLFNHEKKRLANKQLDQTIDMIRNKYGHTMIKRCSLLLDESLTCFNPLSDHTVHPVSVF